MTGVLSEETVLSRIRQMDPYEFERLIGNLWEKRGYNTTVRSGSRDRGIDVIAIRENKKEVIQVKRYDASNKIGSQKVREYATLYQQVEDAEKVIIVTSGYFTEEGQRLGSDLNVSLVNAGQLYQLIEQYGPELAVEYLTDQSQAPPDPNYTGGIPFTEKWKFSRISEEQGIFNSCPECSHGRVWLGQLKKNNLIRLKCELCNAEWKEKREERGWWIFARERNTGWIQVSGENVGRVINS